MTKLTVTVITFNEEKKIDRCLRSVKQVADEIIVVDSLSTDKTREICLSHQVTFIEQPFLGYIEQKNFALSKASNQYVLSLDADEELSNELSAAIIKEKENDFPAAAYRMNRFNFYCGYWIKHGTYYPDRKLRLLDIHKGKWGGQNPHDRIIMTEGTAIKQLQGDLFHYSYETFEDHARQMNRFSSIGAKALFDKGKSGSLLKLLLNPVWAFLRGYIIRLGFLDGFPGFMIAGFTAIETFLKYAKLIQLHHETRKPNTGNI